VLDLVLRLAGLERGTEVAPEPEQACVQHFQHAADVRRLVSVEEHARLKCVPVKRLRSRTVALQKAHRHQAIEEIPDAARMQIQFFPQLLSGHGFVAQRREYAQLHCRQQHLGAPEPETRLQNT